jgi:hypothetical protein
MALTSDELTIGNQALTLIGQKIIDSTDTSTADTGTGGSPYEKLELVFDQCRNALQRSFEWNFARARLELVNDWDDATAYTTDQYVWVSSVLYKCNTAHTSTTWDTDYVLDGSEYVKDGDDYVRDDNVTFYWDMITDRPEHYWTYRYDLPSDFSRFSNKWLRHNELRYALEKNKILCSETELDINYIAKITDPTEFDDLYTEVLIYDIAIKLTYSIMGASYQAQAFRKSLREQRKDSIATAKSVNSIESDQGRRVQYEWVNARLGSGKV